MMHLDAPIFFPSELLGTYLPILCYSKYVSESALRLSERTSKRPNAFFSASIPACFNWRELRADAVTHRFDTEVRAASAAYGIAIEL